MKSDILDTKKQATKPTRTCPYSALLALKKTVGHNFKEKYE